jgi:hypothetical protein
MKLGTQYPDTKLSNTYRYAGDDQRDLWKLQNIPSRGSAALQT